MLSRQLAELTSSSTVASLPTSKVLASVASNGPDGAPRGKSPGARTRVVTRLVGMAFGIRVCCSVASGAGACGLICHGTVAAGAFFGHDSVGSHSGGATGTLAGKRGGALGGSGTPGGRTGAGGRPGTETNGA